MFVLRRGTPCGCPLWKFSRRLSTDAPAKSRKPGFKLRTIFCNNLILFKPSSSNRNPACKNLGSSLFFTGTSLRSNKRAPVKGAPTILDTICPGIQRKLLVPGLGLQQIGFFEHSFSPFVRGDDENHPSDEKYGCHDGLLCGSCWLVNMSGMMNDYLHPHPGICQTGPARRAPTVVVGASVCICSSETLEKWIVTCELCPAPSPNTTLWPSPPQTPTHPIFLHPSISTPRRCRPEQRARPGRYRTWP